MAAVVPWFRCSEAELNGYPRGVVTVIWAAAMLRE